MKRCISLDVFRGLTIILMIIVNSPGNSTAYSLLEHSVWNGCTLADLVFPFFILIVGTSSVLGLNNIKQAGVSQKELLSKIIKRAIYIFILGICLNILPKHFDLSTLRLLGVLQRIAICYFFSAIFFMSLSKRAHIFSIGCILIFYWLLLSCFSSDIVGLVDRIVLSPAHLYRPNFDPEGLLSTIPAIASVLLGNLLGFRLKSDNTKIQNFKWMLGTGIILMSLGWLWGLDFPINKALWTSSYVLWTAGVAYLIFASLYFLIDIKEFSNWSKPLITFGKSSLLVYMLHVIFLKLQAIVILKDSHGELVNLRVYITEFLFGFLPAQKASLCYALAYCFLWYLVLIYLSKFRARVHARALA